MKVLGKLHDPQNRFIILFIGLFVIFYYFNIGFWSLVSPNGRRYNAYIGQNLNYIGGMRSILVSLTVYVLRSLGHIVLHNSEQVMVVARGAITIAYDCIGMGVLSFYAAFALSYPKPIKIKITFLIVGIVIIQCLNVCRLVLLALYWNRASRYIDHHIVFNVIVYIIIGISIYLYTKDQRPVRDAQN